MMYRQKFFEQHLTQIVVTLVLCSHDLFLSDIATIYARVKYNKYQNTSQRIMIVHC